MKILILGYSDLVNRKIIPTLKKFKYVRYDIASKSVNKKNIGQEIWFDDYNEAIEKSDANIVYISLVNSLHYKFALHSLYKRKNVIIDKPITLNLNQTKHLIKIAKQKKLLLSEALVFNYHNQFTLIKKIINKNKIVLDNILMKFCIPKPKENNFKLSKKLGGGCFNDMSPYAAAIVRIFLDKKINLINIFLSNTKKINEGFCLMVRAKKTNFIGVFSHNSEYKNEITFLTKSYSISAYRFSAPPSDINLNVNFIKKNKMKKFLVKKDDMFKKYLDEYFQKLKEKNINFYHDRILNDAKFINKLKKIR